MPPGSACLNISHRLTRSADDDRHLFGGHAVKKELLSSRCQLSSQLSLSMPFPSSQLSVRRLLFTSSPAAVLGRVGAVVVDAVKRAALGPFSHVRQEVLEANPSPEPPIANMNTSTTVAMVVLVPRTVAAGLHALEGCVKRVVRLIGQNCSSIHHRLP